MCAITGVYSPGGDAAVYTRELLYLQQNRGQDTSGIFTLEGATVHSRKGVGKVGEVFGSLELPADRTRGTVQTLVELTGQNAIGHNRSRRCLVRRSGNHDQSGLAHEHVPAPHSEIAVEP